MLSIAVDGARYEVGSERCALQALLELGFHLPYFCWHPALGAVGACRQCAVKQYKDEAGERAGEGRLVMACMTAVSDGLRLGVAEAEAAGFRRAVIEGLMLHHPHDCPVCDEGGQCHLQDMTVMAGHDTRRYRFAKRTFRNQHLGPFLHHEMNRCIQCYRCVRFYREYAGGGDLEAMGIRDQVYFGRARDGTLESEFAGNLAEVCPTGVFTDATLKRHYTRKWDLRWAPSVCAHCGAGCNTSLGERYGEVRVTVNRYHGEVNGYFLCDRGRYGYEYLAAPERLRAPRWQGAATAPDSALARLQELIGEVRAGGAGGILGFGSPRASLESNFALRELVGAGHFFSADPDAGLAAQALGLLRHGPAPAASLRQAEESDAVLVLGEDLTQSAARLALSVRQAARQQPLRELCDPLGIPRWLDHAAREATQAATGPVFVLTPAATRLDAIARAAHRAAPDDLARLGCAIAHRLDAALPGAEEWAAAAGPVAAALLAAERPLIVTGASCGSPALLDAAAAVAAALVRRGRRPRLSVVLPEANSLGLAALAPRPLPEGLEAGGGATLAIVLEADLTRRAPAPLVERFLERWRGGGRRLVVLDQIEHPTTTAAALALPAAGVAEGDGTFVNFEGRAQRFFAVSPPAPAARESWRWLEQAQGRAPALDGVLARLATALPELAGTLRAAPAADFRLAQQKMPREPARCSGRTAMDAARAVSEPKPPADADTALTFTMEGYAAQPPAALTAFFWSPGWNSPQAQLPYQQAINASLRGGDAGVRLFEADGGGETAACAPPPPFAPRAGSFWVLRLPQLFGGEELSRLGRAVAEHASGAFVGVNPAAAGRAGWREGARVRVALDGREHTAALRLFPELPEGLAVVPVGDAAFDAAGLPAWGEIR